MKLQTQDWVSKAEFNEVSNGMNCKLHGGNNLGAISQ